VLLTQHSGGRCACVHGLNRRVGAVWTWQTHVGLRSGATAWRRSCTTGRRGSHLPLPSHIAVSPAVLAPCHSPHVASYRSVGVRTASVVSRQLFFQWRAAARPCPYPTLLTCSFPTGASLWCHRLGTGSCRLSIPGSRIRRREALAG
jgi:hypothetical protein